MVDIKTPDEVTAELDGTAIEPQDAERFENNLAGYGRQCWIKAKEYKQAYEEQLKKNKRQTEGVYEPDKLDAIRAVGGSEVYMLITGTKDRAAKAWVEEVLFQPGAKPWDIETTPIPDLPDEVRAAILEEILSTYLNNITETMAQNPNVDPTQMYAGLMEKLPEIEKQAKELLLQKAKETAEEMALKIDDQLTEGGWYRALFDVIPDIILGTGIIKGPILKKKKLRKPKSDPKTGRITIEEEEQIIPHYEARSPYNIYPAPNSTGVNDGYLIDRITMTPRKLQDLIGIPGFNEEEIKAILEKYKEGKLGGWMDTAVDSELETINSESASTRSVFAGDSDNANNAMNVFDSDKIECMEFWGGIQGSLLQEWGMEVKDAPEAELFYDVVFWQIDSHIIKVMLNDNADGSKPFSKASFFERGDCFWGKGLAEGIADIQQTCNASARAIVANIGFGSGPMLERNIDRIPRDEIDDNVIIPWKVWDVTDEQMSTAPALKFYQPPMVAERILTVFQYFLKLADEHSGIPAYAHGDMNVGGAGRTASGLSMLMTGATRGIRSLINSIDKNIIVPTIEKQYYYNIKQKENYGLVCDYTIVARGSSVLMAKQQQAIRRMEFASALANPFDISLTGQEGRRYMLKEVAKSLDMDADKVFPEQGQQQQQGMMGMEGMMDGGGGQQGGGRTLDVAGNPAQGADFREITGAGGSAKRY